MAENEKKSQMSYARAVDFDSPPNKLDKASQNLREQYQKAKAAQLQQAKAQPTDREQDRPAPSPKPEMHLKPGGNLQKEVDGRELNDQLSKKAKDLKQLNDLAKARHEAQKQLDLKNERDKGNDDRSR